MELITVKTDNIRPFSRRIRQKIDEEKLAEMAASIKSTGIIQPPHVRPTQEGDSKDYELIFGEMRWLAAKKAGLDEIQVIKRDVSEERSAVESLIENVHRSDLHAAEKGLGIHELFLSHGIELTPKKLAGKINRIRHIEKGARDWPDNDEHRQQLEEIQKICNKIGKPKRTIIHWLDASAVSSEIIKSEFQKPKEDRMHEHTISRLSTIENLEKQEKLYKVISERDYRRDEASKFITYFKRAPEPLQKYSLDVYIKPSEMEKVMREVSDVEELRTIINRAKVKNTSILETARGIKVEKGEKDNFGRGRLVTRRYYDTNERVLERVADGRYIRRFHTRKDRRWPISLDEIVCPSFMELVWARGCPFDCAWCYLLGTLRHQPEGKKPVAYDYDKVADDIRDALMWKEPLLFNTGEVSDSLMDEDGNSFSKFIINLFKMHGNGHKILFLSKNSNVDNLIEAEGQEVSIVSFSLNAYPASRRWEKAPSPRKRLKAAKRTYESGYETRIRIDPMVPFEGWRDAYNELIDDLFASLEPERITFGSLRGLQSTINEARDKSWIPYLSERTEWGKKIAFNVRLEMYRSLVDRIRNEHGYKGHLAMCKETLGMWTKLGWDYRKCRCNCVW